MAKKLPADERRAQLLEAALTIAAERGVDALTMRPLAAAAGASLGIVHYHFHDKDTLLTHLGETQILQVNDGVQLAFGTPTRRADRDPGSRGSAARRDPWTVADHRVHPHRQLLTYEITAHALRRRSAGNLAAGVIAERQYRTSDAEAVAFLTLCARRAGVAWITPVDQVARFALACMNGLVLRWLVDRDSDAALIALDDLAAILTTKAR